MIFVLSSNLVVATERTKCRNRFVLQSADFGRCMTPEHTKTFFVSFTSETDQSVVHNRHRIFRFFFQREDIFRHFIGLISYFRLKVFLR